MEKIQPITMRSCLGLITLRRNNFCVSKQSQLSLCFNLQCRWNFTQVKNKDASPRWKSLIIQKWTLRNLKVSTILYTWPRVPQSAIKLRFEFCFSTFELQYLKPKYPFYQQFNKIYRNNIADFSKPENDVRVCISNNSASADLSYM